MIDPSSSLRGLRRVRHYGSKDMFNLRSTAFTIFSLYSDLLILLSKLVYDKVATGYEPREQSSSKNEALYILLVNVVEVAQRKSGMDML